jgi:anaerobic selenocysteine-containing dehydrogenase
MPDALAWRRALTDAFVVATATHVPTETTLFADVVLPVALVAGETAGSVMTLDRRVESLEAMPPPGGARTGDRIVLDLGRVLLTPAAYARLAGAEPWTPYAEWDRWRALADGGFDARGITAPRLGRELAIPWPCAAEDAKGLERLDPAPVHAARPEATRPLVLVVGPLREHSGSRVRTGRTPELHYEAPSAQIEMHPDDGRAAGLADGDWITVESATGAATARVWLTDRAQPGVLFIPEHYGFLSDLQGGSATQQEPEGLGFRVTPADLVGGLDAPAGLVVAVAVRKALRRDLRQRGV